MPQFAKKPRAPKTRAGGEWSEVRFWGFIRSALRQASRRWPPIVRHAMHAVRRPYTGDNPRQKWEYMCAMCFNWSPAKEVHVDHLVPCGSLRSLDDVSGFVERLFCESDGLRVLCENCHKMATFDRDLHQ